MSDSPVTPRPGPGLPATTLPLGAPPPPPPAAPLAAAPPAAPLAGPTRAHATQMSAAVPPAATEPPGGEPRGPAGPGEISAASNPAEEIRAAAVAQAPAHGEPTVRDDSVQAAHAGPSLRIGPATLASPLVPLPSADDGSGSPRPPVPAVIDVGAPAHAFIARPPHASPQMMPYDSAPSPRHAGHAHAYGHPPVGPRSSTNTTVIVLAIVAGGILLLGIGVVLVAAGLVAANRSASEPSERGRPGAVTAAPEGADDPSGPRRRTPPPTRRPGRR